jgi:hypothetical protein
MSDEMGSHEAVAAALEDAELVDVWCWDGDLEHVMGVIEGQESLWFVERGTLKREDEELPGVSNLIEGDVVYRCRKSRALNNVDKRYDLFDWHLVNPFTGRVLS